MFLFLELGFPANIGLSWDETVGGMMVIPLHLHFDHSVLHLEFDFSQLDVGLHFLLTVDNPCDVRGHESRYRVPL